MAIITGTEGPDFLPGTNEADLIQGLGGNDVISGLAGDDALVGGTGNDTIDGGAGNDDALFNVSTDGADLTDLGTGDDRVFVRASAAGQVRLTFTSAEVGNGNPNDGITGTNQDGGLAVRLQAETQAGALTGPVSRFDDEGITFISDTPGVTFDVRDLVSGAARGAAFEIVALGTNGDDDFEPLSNSAGAPIYVNGGAGDDALAGGTGNDFLVGGTGNDLLFGSLGNDGILGGAGDDTVLFGVGTDGADTVDLGAGDDRVFIEAPGQVRLTFTSAEVGNGNPNDAGSMVNQDGGLAVRLQAEAADGTLTGPVSRFDDEGITFIADAPGVSFDVRDLVSGVARGDAFQVVALGTNGNDTFTPFEGAEGAAIYVNGGAGNDTLTGGTGNDFLVGGAGNDTLSGGLGNDNFIGGAGNDFVSGGNGVDRAILSFAFNASQITIAANGDVVIDGPEGVDTFRGIEQFQFSDRVIDNADDNVLVDDLFYLLANPDVAAAGVDPDVHYATFGFREGRDPNAFFSTDGYRAANPGVAQAGTNPVDDYLAAGVARGSDPGANFDNELYLAQNPDVAAAGVNPLVHYLENGRAEGRAIGAAIGRAGDLAAADSFDAQFYLLSNPDIARNALARGGDTFATAREHYDLFGFREGRDPNAVFDTSDYLAENPDVAAAGVNPLVHYDQFGFREGRDPSDTFDTDFYLQSNPDVAAAGINPMEHYLQFGIYEGRAPLPADLT